MNILTYTLQLNDRMSSTLNKVGVTTDSTTQDVRKLKGEVQNLNKISLGGFLSSISRIAGVIGVGAAIGKTIRMGMEQEMRNTSFEVLFGGVDNAKKIVDEISDYAAKSPYGKTGLSEATQMMAGFGIAQERIMPNLKMIGDIAMGDAGKFQSLTLAFSQMSSAGRLTGQDLLQMVSAGFNPLKVISENTGKSMSALRDEMAKGAISADMVTQAFRDATGEGGLYHGMIDKINNTVGGQWAAVQDNISETLLSLYNNVLQPVLLPALKTFNEFLSDPIATIGRLSDKVINSFPVISGAIIAVTAAIAAYTIVTKASAIATMAVTVVTKIWTAAQWLLNAALTANPVGLIVAAVVAFIAVIAFLIIKIDGWGEAWKHTVNGSKLIFLSYVESVKSSFNTVVQGIMIGINKIKEGWYNFKEAIGIGDSSENQKMLAQIHADTEARKKSIVDGYKKTAERLKQSGQEFKNAAGSLNWNDTSFSDVTSGIKNKLGISAPGVPGTEKGQAENFDASRTGKETATGIATGGSKTTHITVNIGEMGNDMKIYVNSVKDGAANIRDIVLDEMTRALVMAQGQVI